MGLQSRTWLSDWTELTPCTTDSFGTLSQAACVPFFLPLLVLSLVLTGCVISTVFSPWFSAVFLCIPYNLCPDHTAHLPTPLPLTKILIITTTLMALKSMCPFFFPFLELWSHFSWALNISYHHWHFQNHHLIYVLVLFRGIIMLPSPMMDSALLRDFWLLCSLSLSLFFFFFLAAGILCPRAGIKPVSLQQKHGVSHWTTRVKTSLLLYPKTKCHPIPSQYAGNCPSPSLQVKSPCLACILLIIFLD